MFSPAVGLISASVSVVEREEYDAAGLDFEGRGRLLDHTIAVCQTLWRQQRSTSADDLLRFAPVGVFEQRRRGDNIRQKEPVA